MSHSPSHTHSLTLQNKLLCSSHRKLPKKSFWTFSLEFPAHPQAPGARLLSECSALNTALFQGLRILATTKLHPPGLYLVFPWQCPLGFRTCSLFLSIDQPSIFVW